MPNFSGFETEIEVMEIKGGQWLARAANPGLAYIGNTPEEAKAYLEQGLCRTRVLLDKYAARQAELATERAGERD